MNKSPKQSTPFADKELQKIQLSTLIVKRDECETAREQLQSARKAAYGRLSIIQSAVAVGELKQQLSEPDVVATNSESPLANSRDDARNVSSELEEIESRLALVDAHFTEAITEIRAVEQSLYRSTLRYKLFRSMRSTVEKISAHICTCCRVLVYELDPVRLMNRDIAFSTFVNAIVVCVCAVTVGQLPNIITSVLGDEPTISVLRPVLIGVAVMVCLSVIRIINYSKNISKFRAILGSIIALIILTYVGCVSLGMTMPH
jgi:hypothetical protein